MTLRAILSSAFLFFALNAMAEDCVDLVQVRVTSTEVDGVNFESFEAMMMWSKMQMLAGDFKKAASVYAEANETYLEVSGNRHERREGIEYFFSVFAPTTKVANAETFGFKVDDDDKKGTAHGTYHCGAAGDFDFTIKYNPDTFLITGENVMSQKVTEFRTLAEMFGSWEKLMLDGQFQKASEVYVDNEQTSLKFGDKEFLGRQQINNFFKSFGPKTEGKCGFEIENDDAKGNVVGKYHFGPAGDFNFVITYAVDTFKIHTETIKAAE